MKNLTIVLIVLIVLSGVGFGVAFFVIKNRNKNKENQVLDTTKEASGQPTESNSLEKASVIDQPIPSDISIPHVDSLNRRFEFSMNYSGIQHKGEFIEGIAIAPFIKKSFGTFRVKQRAPEMETVKVPKDQKIRGGSISTKGEKVRGETAVTTKGGATQLIEVQIPKPSDWVDLEIRDNENRLLHGLSVNLATGATIGALASTEWDGD